MFGFLSSEWLENQFLFHLKISSLLLLRVNLKGTCVCFQCHVNVIGSVYDPIWQDCSLYE